MCCVLRKLDKMPVCKVLSQISLCSPHRLIVEDTLTLNKIFGNKGLPLNEKYHKSGVFFQISLCRLHRLIWDDTLRTCIMPSFLRMRRIYKLFYAEMFINYIKVNTV